MNFPRYIKIWENLFFLKSVFAFPTGDTIESTFLDMYMRLKDFYLSNMVRPVSSISVNHTFKISKSIGGFRLQDRKFINENRKLFIVPNEGLVVNWKLKEIKPELQSVKYEWSIFEVCIYRYMLWLQRNTWRYFTRCTNKTWLVPRLPKNYETTNRPNV